MSARDISSLTLNRLSLYLRALRRLQADDIATVSSGQLAKRFALSASLIRKDLAQFGELGTRGVGYDVPQLSERLVSILGLDRERDLIIVGAGNLGSALAGYVGFNSDSFRVAAIFDNDPAKIGRRLGDLEVRSPSEMPGVIRTSGIRIGLLAVPAEAAQPNYDTMVESGIRAVLNFAPIALREHPEVRTKSVDFRIHLEELSYFLNSL